MHNEMTEMRTARLAAGLWSGITGHLVPFGTSASSVFGVRANGITHFLRLTKRSFRSLEDVRDEMAFLAHLHVCGVRVAMPVPSIDGRVAEEVNDYVAALFQRARGFYVEPGRYWTEALFREWGRAMARQHDASCTFRFPSGGWRQNWRQEPVLVEGLTRIQAADIELSRVADKLLTELQTHAGVLGEVGAIHADIAPQNFRYEPQSGITAFDFDNCCRHWFLYDLAVSMSVLRLRSQREQLVRWIIEGYQELRLLPGEPVLFGLLLRLRLLDVYCDRLYSFGTAPGSEQMNTLRDLRERLIRGKAW